MVGNDGTSGKILVFEMNGHVYGGTSSTSCCNYALKRQLLAMNETTMQMLR